MTRTMYDSVDVGQIPATAAMVAGYVDGHWPTAQLLSQRFPRARRVTITVLGGDLTANVVDIETGDCNPTSGVAWAKRKVVAGKGQPTPYTNLSTLAAVLHQIDAQGLPRTTPIWTAHYTGRPHLCGAACFAGLGLPWQPHVVATQYTDKALGKNLDASLVADYWPGVDPAPKPAAPVYVYKRTLRLGMVGLDVISLKRRLSYLGYRGLWLTPYFGRGLDTSVRAFQKAHGLAVDGVVGPITAKAIG